MKRAKDPWDERNLTNKTNMSNTNYNFRAYHSFGNPSLVHGITAVKWNTYDVETTAGKVRRCHLGRPVAEA